MTIDTIEMMDLKLQGCGAQFKVKRMVLYAEVGHLPLLSLIVEPDVAEQPPPQVNAGPYMLLLDKSGLLSTPFGVSNWFLESVSSTAHAQHRTHYVLRLGALPGQHLSMQGYAVDGLPVSAVLQQVSDRLLGQRTVQSRFMASDPVVGTVLSFNESMDQFLTRMAWATDSWLWAEDAGDAALTLHWQPTLQGADAKADFDMDDWNAACVAREQYAAPPAVRTIWPRSSKGHSATQQTSKALYTQEMLNLLPLSAPSHDTTHANTHWQNSYYLSNNLAHTGAWPGLRTAQDQVIVGTLHVYDQTSSADVHRLLGQMVPGLRETPLTAAAYGVLAIATPSGKSYVSAASALARLKLAEIAATVGTAMGIPTHASAAQIHPPTPHMVMATVYPWDETLSATWAAGGLNGSNRHNTDIKVCFDWSDVPVRVPYGYSMSGSEGIVFCPPAAGDRVLVLLESLWPLLACAAYQPSDVLLPGVLRSGADMDTLSAQRGMVVKGGLIFRTADNGDLVIHAAGNLVLRAEKDIFFDGQHLREHGRAKSGLDDATGST